MADDKVIGKINFLEIPVYDIEKAKKFYTAVLDWECKGEGITDAGAGLHAMYFFKKGDVLHGAFNHMKDGKAFRNHNENDPEAVPLLPTVEVADCAETLAKAEANGGKIQWPKTPIGGDMGCYARFLDPEGNMLGVWSSK